MESCTYGGWWTAHYRGDCFGWVFLNIVKKGDHTQLLGQCLERRPDGILLKSAYRRFRRIEICRRDRGNHLVGRGNALVPRGSIQLVASINGYSQ